jgi:hypothetical protein
VRRLLVTANAVLSSPTLVTLMMEAIRSSETSVLIRAARCNIPEDEILRLALFAISIPRVGLNVAKPFRVNLFSSKVIIGSRVSCDVRA